jgi:hypothetical protein
MTLNAIGSRLHRFFAVLLVLALPLQGQAVASMSCHTGMSVETSSSGLAHANALIDAHATLHLHHQHSQPSADLSQSDLHHPLTSDSPVTAAACALCAACCFASTVGPTANTLPASIGTGHQPPFTWMASSYAGVVLDGLLRPPR